MTVRLMMISNFTRRCLRDCLTILERLSLGARLSLSRSRLTLEVSRTSDADADESRRSRRVKKPTAVVESQQWQIKHGLIPAPGAKNRARALNAKKRRNVQISQLENEF